MSTKVLWIEDNKATDGQMLRGPVENAMGLDLRIAVDVSSAIDMIHQEEFDVIIVDLRNMPGYKPEWLAIFYEQAHQERDPLLGLELMKSLLRSDSARVKLADVP